MWMEGAESLLTGLIEDPLIISVRMELNDCRCEDVGDFDDRIQFVLVDTSNKKLKHVVTE